MPQQQIGPCLISLAVRLQPFENIRIQTHGYRLLRRTVKLADLGSAPIDDCGDIGEINVPVFFAAMAAMSRFCSLVSFLIVSPLDVSITVCTR